VFSEEINQQQVHHFIHQSPWAAQEVMDAFYGRDSSLLATLKAEGIHFIADVPENYGICLEPFQL